VARRKLLPAARALMRVPWRCFVDPPGQPYRQSPPPDSRNHVIWNAVAPSDYLARARVKKARFALYRGRFRVVHFS
jgi:hypothetical protein